MPGDGRNAILADGLDPIILPALTRAQISKARWPTHGLFDNFLTQSGLKLDRRELAQGGAS